MSGESGSGQGCFYAVQLIRRVGPPDWLDRTEFRRALLRIGWRGSGLVGSSGDPDARIALSILDGNVFPRSTFDRLWDWRPVFASLVVTALLLWMVRRAPRGPEKERSGQ